MRISNELRKILESNKTNKIVEKLLTLCTNNRYVNDINYLDIAIENPSKISYISRDRIKRFKSNSYGFKVGAKVFLRQSSDYWGQSEGTIGTISAYNIDRTYSDLNVNVEWLCGKSNIYGEKDLQLSNTKLNIWEKSLRKQYAYMTSPGKLVKKLGIECSDKDVQEFGRLFYSDKLLSAIEGLEFRVLKGQDIVEYYADDKYSNSSGSLGNSCMRYDSCSELIQFYAKNPDKVGMLVLYKEDTDTISGRALVWYDVKMKSPESKTIILLDRVYVNNDNHSSLFVSYAKANGWYYKERNSADYNREIGIGEESLNAKLSTTLSIIGCDKAPWMDTFAWGAVSGDEVILNNHNDGNEFRDTDGVNWYGKNSVYSEWHGEDIEEDDAVYSNFLDDYILRDDAVELKIDGRWQWMPTEHDEIYRVRGDYYHISDLKEDIHGNMQLLEDVTEIDGDYYPNDEVVFSEYLDEDIVKSESVYSEYHKSYIKEDDATEHNGDWYSNDVVDTILKEEEELVEIE